MSRPTRLCQIFSEGVGIVDAINGGYKASTAYPYIHSDIELHLQNQLMLKTDQILDRSLKSGEACVVDSARHSMFRTWITSGCIEVYFTGPKIKIRPRWV